jgi:hypothetical protein
MLVGGEQAFHYAAGRKAEHLKLDQAAKVVALQREYER